MRIDAGISAINANRLLRTNQNSLSKSMEKLSSSKSINRAGDNAAGLAISEKLKAQMTSLNRAAANAYDGISFIQTAEGGLSATHEALQQMREVAVQASNGTLTTDDRAQLQQTVTQLNQDIDRVASTTEFNTQKILDGSLATEGITFEVSPEANTSPAMTVQDMTPQALGIADLDLTTPEGAQAAIKAIDNAIDMVSSQRAELGSMQDRLEYSINNLNTTSQNIVSAGSQIGDIDMAEEMSEYTRQNILQQANMAMQAQVNKQASSVLNLLNR